MRFQWTKRGLERLTVMTLQGAALPAIAERLGCHERTARDMQIELGLAEPMRRRKWSDKELETVQSLYADTRTEDLARKLGRTVSQVYQTADRLGLAKSAAYLASPEACRLRRGDNVGAAFRFKPGQVPPNKGLRRPGWAPGRMKETQFRKGERRGVAAENYCPLGTIKADGEGYLRIKVRDALPGEYTGFGNVRVWPLMQRHVWELQNGSIPAGHNVVFKDGNRSNCQLDNLELVSRAEMMRRNTVHRLPKELALAIQLNGALKRKIRRLDAPQHHD